MGHIYLIDFEKKRGVTIVKYGRELKFLCTFADYKKYRDGKKNNFEAKYCNKYGKSI